MDQRPGKRLCLQQPKVAANEHTDENCFLDLPNEVLCYILRFYFSSFIVKKLYYWLVFDRKSLCSFLSHDDLARTVRLVCRQLRGLAQGILNRNFCLLEKQIENALKEIDPIITGDRQHSSFKVAFKAQFELKLVRSDVSGPNFILIYGITKPFGGK